MSKEYYIIDDRCIVPEEIKKMSREERDREIARYEQEAREKKARAEREKTKHTEDDT